MPTSPEATQIRIATASDSQDLLDLILRFRDHLRTTVPNAESLERYLPVALADETVEFYLVSFGDGPAIGYAQARFYNSIWSTGTECTLEDLFVGQEARGRGAGARLLEFVIDRAHERDARVIQLYTNDKNLEAQALYRRHGFAPESHAVFVDGREVRWGLQIQ